MKHPLLPLVVASVLLAQAGGATARPYIAIGPRVPSFRFYDVARRERFMARTLAQLAGTPALSHQKADTALGELDDIRRDQAARRRAHGGRLTSADLRVINARLNRLATQVGLR